MSGNLRQLSPPKHTEQEEEACEHEADAGNNDPKMRTQGTVEEICGTTHKLWQPQVCVEDE